MNTVPSLQDFSLIRSYVQKCSDEFGLDEMSIGFMFFAIESILNLQDDEIKDAITDTHYLATSGGEEAKGHDRGIDAIYIDDSENPATVHIFNFKHTDKFEKTGNNFPSNEIDKIVGFLRALMQKDENLEREVNQALSSRVKEIWTLFDSQNPSFVIHLCANYHKGFESGEQKRFEREIGKFSSIAIEYHLTPWFVSRLTKAGKQVVDAHIRAIDKNLYEKSDGDIRALIVNVDARDLLRIVVNDEDMRKKADLQNFSVLQEYEILEDAFEDNVRLYLKQRSKINRNIKETALSEEAHRFFYFNNGITITCSNFKYPMQVRSPIIELSNLQVVNGGQTLHALFDAFKENSSRFENIDLLCRIYETQNEALSTDIAEYTNSQNPVKSRDIRSNDFVQKKLEKELVVNEFYYERKKGQHSNKPKAKRLDAEKVGQALLAFYNLMPAEAKNQKRVIFAEKYDEIFSDTITADAVLLAFDLFNEVERRKSVRKHEILENPIDYDSESFILHATYYVMYVMSLLTDKKGILKNFDNFDQITALYDEALNLVKNAAGAEKERLKEFKENYSHRTFFTGNRAKIQIEKLIEEAVTGIESV